MNSEFAIRAVGLNKKYRLYDRPIHRVTEKLTRKKKHREVWALKDFNLEVQHGQAIGIVGSNGAGKSTLLKLLSGTSAPTEGTFEIHGVVASLLELGTGFYPGFTGYQNVFLAGQVMGFSRKQMEEKVDEIIGFSELGDFIHQPIRTYSSGMVMRLGFSVATAIDPDVLIIDEILAVGDLHFQKRCIDRIMSFRSAGKTILFCSHSLYHVEEICDHALWIKDGQCRMFGPVADVCRSYEFYERARRTSHGSLVAGEDPVEALTKSNRDKSKSLAGDEMPFHGEIPHIERVRVLNAETGEEARIAHPETSELVYGGKVLDDFIVEIDYEIPETLPELVVGLAVYRSDHEMMAGLATHMGDFVPPSERGHYRAHLKLPAIKLLHGSYKLVCYIAGEKAVHIYHSLGLPGTFLLKQDTNFIGVMYLDHQWQVSRRSATGEDVTQPAVGGDVNGER